MKNKCKNCRCWVPDADPHKEGWGQCRPHGPRPQIMEQVDGVTYHIVWASTGKDDGCYHDFVPKESK